MSRAVLAFYAFCAFAESVTCRFYEAPKGSNPTLTAI